jgi:hypothetical protein
MARTTPADRKLLVRLATGVARSRSEPTATPEAMQAELAARWLPAEQLEPARR